MSDLPIKISLPENFLKEEVRCGHTVSTEIKAVWAVELDLLVEFDNVCNKLGIKYCLDGGTLLGSIRHQGFIPWDDDIDVIMLREDYDILLQKGKELFCFPYFLQTYETDNGYFRPHSQIRNSLTTGVLNSEKGKVSFNQGIFIDVFVLDGLTTDNYLLQKQIDKQNRISDLFYKMYNYGYYCNKGHNLEYRLKEIRAKILRLIIHKTARQLYIERDQIIKSYNAFNTSEYVDAIGFRTIISKVKYLRREWFANTTYGSFEGFRFRIPQNYDMVLKEYFGENYLIPEKLANKHGKVIFDPYKSYIDYLKN